MSHLIHDSEGKAYFVSATVVRFLDEHNVSEDDFITVIGGMMWHDVHTTAVDVLASTDLTTSGDESGWLLHKLAREVNAAE